jgi:hypothetical protein
LNADTDTDIGQRISGLAQMVYGYVPVGYQWYMAMAKQGKLWILATMSGGVGKL